MYKHVRNGCPSYRVFLLLHQSLNSLRHCDRCLATAPWPMATGPTAPPWPPWPEGEAPLKKMSSSIGMIRKQLAIPNMTWENETKMATKPPTRSK